MIAEKCLKKKGFLLRESKKGLYVDFFNELLLPYFKGTFDFIRVLV